MLKYSVVEKACGHTNVKIVCTMQTSKLHDKAAGEHFI